MFVLNAQNGLHTGGYTFDNALVVLDATDAGSLVQNANGLKRWRDGSGKDNDVIAAAGGEPLVTNDGVQFTGNRSLELAVPLFPSSAQAYPEWGVVALFTPQNQANQHNYASLFAPSNTASGNTNILFIADGQWGVAAGGSGFPRIGAVTENADQLLIISSSKVRQSVEAHCTGTGDSVAYSGSIDNGIWNFGLGYGMQGTLKLFALLSYAPTYAQRQALRQQISAQTGQAL